MARVLIPIPSRDFDPSEVAVSWRVLSSLGHEVSFATPNGEPGAADELMLTGRGFDPWSRIPGLRAVTVVGRFLRADANARDAYAEMQRDARFQAPGSWDQISLSAVDGLLLPGGHRARGMREFIESATLQGVVVDAFARGMPVAAICHGVLLAARSRHPQTSRSVLHGRRTTALTWGLEGRAWGLARRTRFWDPDYYRTYTEEPGQSEGFMSVQQEVTRALASPADFLDVTSSDPDAAMKRSGRKRDSPTDERPAFVVEDGNYVSARWPGDTNTFAKRFAQKLSAHAGSEYTSADHE